MKIVINNQLGSRQKYSCLNCGHGCRSFMIAVSIAEQKAIMELEDWFASLGVDELFTDVSAPGFSDGALAKRNDNSCVFLGSDNLCEIHKKYGLQAKPLVCQLFPYTLTPFNNNLRVGLRFDCKGVCQSSGQLLKDNISEIKAIADKVYPDEISKDKLNRLIPAVHSKQKVSADRLDNINNAICTRYINSKLSLKHKLTWLATFAEHIEKVKWQGQNQNDFEGLLSLLADGTVNEIEKREFNNERPTKRARVLFGQILYLLCHQPETITSVKKSRLQLIKDRFVAVANIRRFGKPFGPVPPLWHNWQGIDFSDIETGKGHLDEASYKLIDRYIINRLAGFHYCGPNYYNYSLTDGIYSLILAVCTINWLGRLNANINDHTAIKYDDIENAVITVDSNNGYGSALNAGAAKYRLQYLKSHIYSIINSFID